MVLKVEFFCTSSKEQLDIQQFEVVSMEFLRIIIAMAAMGRTITAITTIVTMLATWNSRDVQGYLAAAVTALS